MDKLFFKNLQILASVGVLPQEKQAKQTLLIDLEFAIDARDVSTLAETINYAEVHAVIVRFVTAQHYDLLETLAEGLATTLNQQCGLRWLRLTLKKPDIFADMEAVGLTLEREFA